MFFERHDSSRQLTTIEQMTKERGQPDEHVELTMSTKRTPQKPIFPAEFHDIESIDDFRFKTAEFILSKLRRDIGIWSDGKNIKIQSQFKEKLPNRIDGFDFIQWQPIGDLTRKTPEISGPPCNTPGYCHQYSPCSCVLCPEDYQVLKRIDHIKTLNLSWCYMTVENWEILFADCPVNELMISAIPTLPHWKPLENLSNLSILEVQMNELHFEHINTINKLPGLRHLIMDHSRFVPGILQRLANHPGIETLSLKHCSSLSRQDFEGMAKIPKLKALSLDCSVIPDGCLNIIAKNTSLKKISLGGNGITRTELENFQRTCPEIEVQTVKNAGWPIRFSEIPETTTEIPLGDICWETAQSGVSAPGPFKLKSDRGEREKSFWASSQSKLIFKPAKQWNSFESGIGLIHTSPYPWDRAWHTNAYIHMPGQNEGTVVFVVKGDGKELYRSNIIREGNNEQAITVDISDVDTLELIVEDAGDGPRFDAAAWFAPKLNRKL